MATMMREMFVQEILEKLSHDEAFLQALAAAENAGDARQVLSENGFDMSLEQVEALVAAGEHQAEKFLENGMDCELSEGELEDVAGGGVIRGLIRSKVSKAALFGLAAIAPRTIPAAACKLGRWSAEGYAAKGL